MLTCALLGDASVVTWTTRCEAAASEQIDIQVAATDWASTGSLILEAYSQV